MTTYTITNKVAGAACELITQLKGLSGSEVLMFASLRRAFDAAGSADSVEYELTDIAAQGLRSLFMEIKAFDMSHEELILSIVESLTVDA